MGVTKQYLRYEPSGVFGIVGSSRANVVYLNLDGNPGKFCAVAACEHVFIWDLRKIYKVRTLLGDKHEVTRLARCPDNQHIAVGYADGAIRIFDLHTGSLAITFSGHKSSVSALNYDGRGMRLVSGSKDTDVIVWDIINESGLYRLKGHKGIITQTRFLENSSILITSCKDTFVKFWDLDTQHCFRTLVAHRTEVWDFVIAREESLLITGSADNEIRVFSLEYQNQSDGSVPSKRRRVEVEEEKDSDLDSDSENENDEESILTCHRLGSIHRTGKDRVYTLSTDPAGRLLGCHGSDSSLELFRITTQQEAEKLLQKKNKKVKRKARDAGLEDSAAVEPEHTVEYDLRRLSTVYMAAKMRSFDCIVDSAVNKARVLALLNNNTLQMVQVDVVDKKVDAEEVLKLAAPGHQTDVRTLCWSSDNTAMLSGGGDALKVWNRSTLQCIRTMTCDYALCSVFAPGDRHVIVGTKTGKLQLFDIAAGSLLETVDAHQGAVWSICMAPDKRGIVTGSADHEVKFWDFELVSDEEYSTTSKRLSVVHARTLKMTEDVLCVKYSPDQKFLAVSLLDNTVKVFFSDTLKFFLSLYGHKLPVLCLDISSDSTLLVTGSADRNIKLWGLDFGDCHKSIFAHDDSIMCVQFVPNTHLFFSGGKDSKLKQWDADSFEHILTLDGHHGELWSLAISPSGNFVMTASHDKSVRLWEKTQEPLVLDVEREMAREREHDGAAAGESAEPVIAGETEGEAGIAGKKTVETVKAAERLMEAIELYRDEQKKLDDWTEDCKRTRKELPPPPLHVMFQAFQAESPTHYVLQIIKKIKSSELEESLLVMPFSYVVTLLALLNAFIEKEWEVELSCRCLMFLLRIHQGQVTSNQILLPVISDLRDSASRAVNALRDTIGFNRAGLLFLKQQMEQKQEVQFFMDATDKAKQKKRKEKKKVLLAIKT